MSSDYFIDKPGIDTAEIVADGKVFPVVMTIPFDTNGNIANIPAAGGWEPPAHNKIVLTEDAAGKLSNVSYLLDNVEVDSMDFTYSNYTFVEPYKTITVARGNV